MNMKLAKSLIDKINESAERAYRLTWKGSKIPRGATVGGVEIGWTQHGMITGKDGEQLGTYTRVVEFGGDDGDEHEMTCYVSDAVIAPDGSDCELSN